MGGQSDASRSARRGRRPLGRGPVLRDGHRAGAPRHGGNAHPAWEYRVLTPTDFVKTEQAFKEPAEVNAAIEAKFNESGQDGWELALSPPGTLVFKRPKR
jgi:hypothetical protein